MNPDNAPIAATASTPARPAGYQRRGLLVAAAGVATLAGAGLAWWNSLPSEAPGGQDDFWQLKFDTPVGTSLAMASLKGKPLLLNFWATWCPPCVEELPLIDGFFQKNKTNGWQVLGLAVDQLSAVNGFLAKAPLTFPVALAGMSGVALSKSLGNLGGGLPFTVLFGGAGAVLHRKMGRVTNDDLSVWAGLK